MIVLGNVFDSKKGTVSNLMLVLRSLTCNTIIILQWKRITLNYLEVCWGHGFHCMLLRIGYRPVKVNYLYLW